MQSKCILHVRIARVAHLHDSKVFCGENRAWPKHACQQTVHTFLFYNVVVPRMMIHVLRNIRAKKLLHAPTTWLAVHTSVRMKVSITANCKNIWRRLWGHLYSWWKHCAVIGAALPGALYSSARAYHCKWHSSGEDTRSFKARRTGDLSCQRKKT